MKFLLSLAMVFVFAAAAPAQTIMTASSGPDSLFSFLYEQNRGKKEGLRAYLISEFRAFAMSYPDHERAADASFLAGALLAATGNRDAALAMHARSVLLYPGNPQRASAMAAARTIIEKSKQYRGSADLLLKLLFAERPEASQADIFFAYLEFLALLPTQKSADIALDAMHEAARRYPDAPRRDLLALWAGEVYAKAGDYAAAAASYKKLEVLFPESDSVAYARFQRGTILNAHLKRHREAYEVFDKLASENGDSEYATRALLTSADILAGKTKNYQGAIDLYRRFADYYPNHGSAIDALMAIAEIRAKRLRDYQGAVDTYDEVVNDYPGNEKGIEALVRAGDLYRDKARDYVQAARYHARVAEYYPTSNVAPKYLLEAGKLIEEKARDMRGAISYYELLLEKYPESRQSKSARRRLTKAYEKLGS